MGELAGSSGVRIDGTLVRCPFAFSREKTELSLSTRYRNLSVLIWAGYL